MLTLSSNETVERIKLHLWPGLHAAGHVHFLVGQMAVSWPCFDGDLPLTHQDGLQSFILADMNILLAARDRGELPQGAYDSKKVRLMAGLFHFP